MAAADDWAQGARMPRPRSLAAVCEDPDVQRAVCTDNSVRVDYVSESPNVSDDDRSVLPLPGPVRLCVTMRRTSPRRNLVWINVTPHPTAEWIARQITEAFPWNEAPRYLLRDRDRVYGTAVTTDYGLWASATSLLHRPRLGRMVSLNG